MAALEAAQRVCPTWDIRQYFTPPLFHDNFHILLCFSLYLEAQRMFEQIKAILVRHCSINYEFG